MSILGNILWIILGGLATSLFYFIGGILMCLTIVGVPFGLQIFKISSLALMPFGRSIYPKRVSNTSGCIYTILNILWIIFFGLELATAHLIIGIILCITIIGIPFGKQHFKLMRLAIFPFGSGIA